jgi:hypothetical protein|tara:strand:+ start:569 stop:769 length:201 start_codon:yes stop_codon:yes gene_type:complete
MKKKISAWFSARKAQFLMMCDDIHQMLTEGREELKDRLGVKTFQVLKGLVIAAFFFGVVALMSEMF